MKLEQKKEEKENLLKQVQELKEEYTKAEQQIIGQIGLLDELIQEEQTEIQLADKTPDNVE